MFFRNFSVQSLIALLLISTSMVATAAEYRVGVLAYRGGLNTLDRWQATADYLNQSIPGDKFSILPLDLAEMDQAVRDGAIDFVITNTGQYVGLEVFYGLSRIATLKKRIGGNPYTKFGAIIFVRADRNDINTIADLKGRSLIGVERNGFGGFQMAWREMLRHGVDPFKDLNNLSFSGFPLDNVAYAVRAGAVDAGTFRSESLERMAQEGKINLDDYKVLNQQPLDDYPMMRSTQLYPEWPFAKVKHVPSRIAEQVARVLVKMPTDSEAAQNAGIDGWTIPVNYQPVHEMMMELQIGPYEQQSKVILENFLRKYWPWVIATTILTIAFLFSLTLLGRANEARRKAETMLRQQQDHVVELVHSRTSDIVAMRDQAIAASEAKSAFLSKMSHELRVPLSSIMGYSEILIDELEQSGSKGKNFINDLKKIKLSGQHLLNIIKDILDITRLDAGDAKVEMQTFLFSDVLDEVMRSIEPFAQENHNILEIDNELISTTVETDRFHLQEAMLQVLKNACKYTEHGKITVHIYNEHHKNKDWLICVVTDTGIGMTFAQQEQLFHQFSLNEQSIPQRGDGIALGLVIGRAYCRIMGGDISFKSEIGKGSEFTIRIPVNLPQSHRSTGTI